MTRFRSEPSGQGVLFAGLATQRALRRRQKRRDGKVANAHTALVRTIERWASLRPRLVRIARTPAGVVPIGRDAATRWLHMAPRGWPDLTGFGVLCGHVIAIEAKLPGDHLSEDQDAFLQLVKGSGGHAFVIWDAAELATVMAELAVCKR